MRYVMRRRVEVGSVRRLARMIKTRLKITELKKYTTNSQKIGPGRKCGAGFISGALTIRSVVATKIKNALAATYRKRTPHRRRPRETNPVMARIASEACT